jgi:thiopurine S-methyltransferase
MEREYWLKKWQQSSEQHFHQMDINPALISYLHELNLHHGDYIFVPLCGKTRDMHWLAENGYHVIGVELSPIACNAFFSEINVEPQISKQKKFIVYRHKNIELICGDWFELTKDYLPHIHAVYDCKALVALPHEMRKQYVNQFITCFGTDAPILLLTIESSYNVNGPPFSVNNTEVRSLYGSYFEISELYRKEDIDIPANLSKKNFIDMTECVYLISK